MPNAKILLVEDDADILRVNSIYLKRQNYTVFEATTVDSAYSLLTRENPDLIVLDVRLPDGSGVDLCAKIRQESSVPIIFLTCLGEETDKVEGLMAGGDDYMQKPYSLAELAARIHAMLRRADMNQGKVYRFHGLHVDSASQRVFLENREIPLTAKEYQLLLYMVKRAGQTVPAEEIYEKVWNTFPEEGLKTLRVHISTLRSKLKMDYDTPVRFRAVRGSGYIFESDKDGGEPS